MKRLVSICCAAAFLFGAVALASEDAIPLFDGKTLKGWHVKCVPGDRDKVYWKVADGAITTDVPRGSKHNYIWLMTDDEYTDFELTLKVQTLGGGNTGIQIRSRYDDEAQWLDGPQVDIHPPGTWRCGFIYDETREAKQWISPIVGKPRMAKPEHATDGVEWKEADEGDGWNDMRIVCRGTRIKVFINDVLATNYDGAGYLDDSNHRAHRVGMKGHIALQIHSNADPKVRFKDIRLKRL